MLCVYIYAVVWQVIYIVSLFDVSRVCSCLKFCQPVSDFRIVSFRFSLRNGTLLVPARLMGQYCFAGWRLSSSSVTLPVCGPADRRARGRSARRRPGTWAVDGRHCTAGQSCYVSLGRRLVLGYVKSRASRWSCKNKVSSKCQSRWKNFWIP